METRNGKALAGLLAEWLGYTSAITETCSVISRHAVTLDRLAVEECNGPEWVHRLPISSAAKIERWQRELDAKWERYVARISKAVGQLPETDNGPISVQVGGDPRGYVVVLVVPTERGPVGIGLDKDGPQRGAHVVEGVR